MDSSKIGNFIKKIRKDNKLTQKDLADKYNVTYQAVSKWENGKNIPDISLLKEISNIFEVSVEEILDGQKKETKKKKSKIFLIIGVILILLIFIWILLSKESSFEFRTLDTTCEDFNISGSIAYNSSKTSIYISDITYCGKETEKKYKKIECILYQTEKNIKTEIDNATYEEEKEITLEEFLKNVNFNIDHYSKNCKMYKNNSLSLEIKATDTLDKTEYYKIPLTVEENCKN